MDSHKIQNAILEYVAASATKITPPQLEKSVSNRYGLTQTQIKALIKDLISSGDLTYTYEYGSTFLEKSFSKPVRISTFVVLKPPGHHYRQKPDDAVIRIKSGASFGGGRHPTTRLSVKAIEYVIKQVRPNWLKKDSSVLDIGTGSGILAIAAVCLGIKKGLGIDIDACALAEARDNIVLNHLQDQLVISDQQIEAINGSYSLVIANLRVPSLKKFYPQISKLTDTNGWVVLSGFRPHERQDLLARYTAQHFECIWTADELDWSATVLKRK